MARPILVVKNLAALVKNVAYAKKARLGVYDLTTPSTKKDREAGDFETGKRAVRAEFGLPYALLDAAAAQGGPGVLAKLAKAIYEGSQFDAQKLQRLKAAAVAGKLTDDEFVTKAVNALT